MRCALFILTVATLSLSAASPATADPMYYVTTWTGVGGAPCGVEVDASGNVYAADILGPVLKYNSSGALLNTIGAGLLSFPTDVAVSPTDGSIYVPMVNSSTPVINKFAGDGTPSTLWADTLSLSAVTDSSGNVYSAGVIDTTLRKYDPTGTTLNTWTIPAQASGLALNPSQTVAYTTDEDATGNLVAIDLNTSAATPLATLIDASDRCAVAVNPKNGNIYVAERAMSTSGPVVEEFTSTGTLIRQWNTWGGVGSVASYTPGMSSSFSSAYGIAFDALTDRLYVSDRTAQSIVVFQEGGTVVPEPSVIMLAATGVLSLLAYAWRKRK
jgi:hypothetical protein